MDGTAARLAEPTLTAADRASLIALSGVIGRIEHTIDEETAALRAHRSIDLQAVNHRKRQGLLELSLLVPSISRSLLQAGARDRLTALSHKLDLNRDALEVQLRAVREVAEIIAAMIRDAESDGTYTMPSLRR